MHFLRTFWPELCDEGLESVLMARVLLHQRGRPGNACKGVEVEMFIGESNYQGGVAFESYPVLDFVKVASTVAEVAALVLAEQFSHDRSAMGSNGCRY